MQTTSDFQRIGRSDLVNQTLRAQAICHMKIDEIWIFLLKIKNIFLIKFSLNECNAKFFLQNMHMSNLSRGIT